MSITKNASNLNFWYFKMLFEKNVTRKLAAINKTTLKRSL